MSFILNKKTILSKDKDIIKKRIYRLVWPHVVWTIIYWIIYFVGEKFSLSGNEVEISDFYWQLFLGHSKKLNPAMWFQIVLIILSVLFFFFFYYFRKNIGIMIVIFMGMIALLSQYSGINYDLFSRFRYEIKYPLGRICEMLPYASMGFCFSYYHCFKLIDRWKRKTLSGILLIGIMLKFSDVFDNVGFYYSGLDKIFISLFIVAVFFYLPENKLTEKLRKHIILISKYSFGVYCMHFIIGRCLIFLLGETGVLIGSFNISILIYLICVLICFILDRMPWKFLRILIV